MAKHHIKVTALDEQTFISALYRPGPKAREFENADIDKMVCKKLIDPA